MQTFLSESTFKLSAVALDNKRLNKQLLEARQILNLLVSNGLKAGWSNHPAARQWVDYVPLLYKYIEAMKDECATRGIKHDTNWIAVQEIWSRYEKREFSFPFWWHYGSPEKKRVVFSHRARLYIKDPSIYVRYKKYVGHVCAKPCCEKCQYFWPSHYEQQQEK